jgi:hypothetical protein
MAELRTINGTEVKVRHPLAPLGLSIITFGIYQLFWYYKINSEMERTGEDVNPGIALLAHSLGAFLLIPPFVSWYKTCARIQSTQLRFGKVATMNPVLGLVLLFIPIVGIFATAYLQSELNKAWG